MFCGFLNYEKRAFHALTIIATMGHLIEYEDANDEVRAVYDDIRATRKIEYINNFWKAIANHPPTLQRTWQNVKEVMTAPGELDPLTRELIYIAVSVKNGCPYCISSHTAAGRAKGMDDAIFGELMAIVATANATNRLANGYQIPVDEQFKL
ncbi:carboxymuconolactone decarboxylase family protein [Microcoleus sp. CZ3-B4]|uniref:carboxymuconolactone decarboxylase family protein n=2 Tax=unclassified Microcoleus TaxID=2642155 RepID=UPI002FCEAE31